MPSPPGNSCVGESIGIPNPESIDVGMGTWDIRPWLSSGSFIVLTCIPNQRTIGCLIYEFCTAVKRRSPANMCGSEMKFSNIHYVNDCAWNSRYSSQCLVSHCICD